MTPAPRRRPVVYKRQETDREYRARLLMHPRVYPSYTYEARNYHGTALDAIGEILGCLRRIVEVCEP
jgi:hypothetical protein